MPESRWITHSVRKPKPSFPMVTWPEKPPSKYLDVASTTRSLTLARRASPISIFLPDTRNGMIGLRYSFPLKYTYGRRSPAARRHPDARHHDVGGAAVETSERHPHRGLL